jgi:hypothetical protein
LRQPQHAQRWATGATGATANGDEEVERSLDAAGYALDALERELRDLERPNGRLALEVLRLTGLADDGPLRSTSRKTSPLAILDDVVTAKRASAEYGGMFDAMLPDAAARSGARATH